MRGMGEMGSMRLLQTVILVGFTWIGLDSHGLRGFGAAAKGQASLRDVVSKSDDHS